MITRLLAIISKMAAHIFVPYVSEVTYGKSETPTIHMTATFQGFF